MPSQSHRGRFVWHELLTTDTKAAEGFFTKVAEVEDFWHEILPDGDFLMRPRMSRIYYNNKFFDYPLKAGNALTSLGILEALRCVLSYLWVRVRPPKDQSNFEGWVAARFGWRLYRIFFKTYTEKVWGVPATEIQADWAAQRIKNLSLWKAVMNAVLPKRNQKDITSLIEEFQYPKYGPGMMWEVCRDKVEAQGSKVVMETRITAIRHRDGRATSVVVESEGGQTEHLCSHLISSMPISGLVLAMDPPAPAEVQAAARGLAYRDFLTIALVVPESAGFPDNWIYVHSPEVRLGRIQNFGSWSPYLVKEGRTCLGLEYFVFEGDDLWASDDADLVELGKHELEKIGLVKAADVEAGYVVRMPKAYPVYDEAYKANVDTIRAWLDANVANVYPTGRNGMHRYNNQDHSMLTAMTAVDNIVAGGTVTITAASFGTSLDPIEVGLDDTGDGLVDRQRFEAHDLDEVLRVLAIGRQGKAAHLAVLAQTTDQRTPQLAARRTNQVPTAPLP